MLNISETIYAGWDTTNQKYELPEAEIIPLGNSVNEQKKLARHTKKYTVLDEHTNIPLPGFTLYKTDRKLVGSYDQTWLVIDPRGFLVRISSDNLNEILHVTGITEGLIQQKCVWARKNTETRMQLVPVSSQKYSLAVENTDLIDHKVDMKTVQIGDTVLLMNQLKGIYRGVLSMYGSIDNSLSTAEYRPKIMLRRQIIEIDTGKFHYQTDLKILKVLDRTQTPITREESCNYINSCIQDGISYFTNTVYMNPSFYNSNRNIKYVSVNATANVQLSLEEIYKNEAQILLDDSFISSNPGSLVLEDSSKNLYLIDIPYYSSTIRPKFMVVKIIQFNTEKLTLEKETNNVVWGRSGSKISYTLDYFVKFYKIVKHVKNHTYI